MQILLNFSFSFIATAAFGIITNVPRRALVACGLTGCSGWLVYWFLYNHGAGLTLANFSGAFFIGILSIFFSRRMQMPMIIFYIPGLVPLVPGGPAYMAVRELMMGNDTAGLQNIMVVIATAGAIAVGFMFISFMEKVFKKYRQLRGK